MRTILLVLGFLCWTNFGLTQEATIVSDNPCYKELYIKSHLYSKYPYISYDEFLSNYIKENYPKAIKYISKCSNNLVKITNKSCLENYIFFQNEHRKINQENISVEITLQTLELTVDYDKILSDPYVIFEEEVEKYLSYEYFGYIPRMDVINVHQISSIICNTPSGIIEIDREYYNDLLNPSTCFNYRSIQPIKAYYDPQHKAIYIYIIGVLPKKFIDGYDRISDSYAAKIIVDINSTKVERIIVPGGYLSTYGWMFCSDFWVF